MLCICIMSCFCKFCTEKKTHSYKISCSWARNLHRDNLCSKPGCRLVQLGGTLRRSNYRKTLKPSREMCTFCLEENSGGSVGCTAGLKKNNLPILFVKKIHLVGSFSHVLPSLVPHPLHTKYRFKIFPKWPKTIL